jgi:hypothetical protein
MSCVASQEAFAKVQGSYAVAFLALIEAEVDNTNKTHA